jgi:hypothetical protein
MRRILVIGTLILAVMVLAVPTARAQGAPPCNDADGDGAPSGREYATNHVSAMAMEGMIGAGGHIPGSHQGFSLCLGVHD